MDQIESLSVQVASPGPVVSSGGSGPCDIDTGRGAEQNHAILWIEFRRRLCHRLLRENGVYALTDSGRATLVALLERARIIPEIKT